MKPSPGTRPCGCMLCALIEPLSPATKPEPAGHCIDPIGIGTHRLSPLRFGGGHSLVACG